MPAYSHCRGCLLFVSNAYQSIRWMVNIHSHADDPIIISTKVPSGSLASVDSIRLDTQTHSQATQFLVFTRTISWPTFSLDTRSSVVGVVVSGDAGVVSLEIFRWRVHSASVARLRGRSASHKSALVSLAARV